MPDDNGCSRKAQVEVTTSGEPAITATELEVIAGYRVHPLASMFPLITGKEFEQMKEAAARAGRLPAAELHEGLLIDGRNRLRVLEALRRQGIAIEVPVVEWLPANGETVEEHIWAVNNNRRHLTADQRAALATAFLPEIEASRKAKQQTSRFGSSDSVTVAANSPSPEKPPPKGPRTSQEKERASSVGELGRLADVSCYKAKQAVQLVKAVRAGQASQSDLDAVVAGDKPLREVTPARRKTKKRPPESTLAGAPPEEQAQADTQIAEEGKDAGNDQPPSEEAARRLWDQWTNDFAVADMPSWRRHFLKVIHDDQRKYGR